ncbi:sigma-70 family RNA polymerase sigma factor [Planococcus rifietoensis]|uniref:sigma-70 family RNA polymerase sigma factor n=1 Tax=Planococcus rifietoensis TaxID=200991 RepID=UPI00384CA12D
MMIWADELILQYKKHRGELIQKRAKLNKEDPQDKLDLTQYNSMIDEMDFVLQWLETGRDPNNYRGADKKGIYQSQSFQSMDFIPDITEQIEEGPKHLYMSAEEKIIMADIFASLSFRERQCYILHEAAGLSMGKIADEVGLKRRTVQQYIERAREKIKTRVG